MLVDIIKTVVVITIINIAVNRIIYKREDPVLNRIKRVVAAL